MKKKSATAQMAGAKRPSPSAATTAAKKPKSSSSPPPPPLAALLPRLASALALSRHFLSRHDLLLPPSLSLPLGSSIRSAALAFSRLLQTLDLPPDSLQTLIKALDPESTHPSPPPSPSTPWFPRFLAAAAAPSDPRWLEFLRMSKPAFDVLRRTLAPSLRSGRLDLPPEIKIGAALFRLAHAAPFGAVAELFGLPSPEPACRVFYEVCRAAAVQLGHLFELAADPGRVIRGFSRMRLPNCCGALGFARFAVEGGGMGGAAVAQGLVDSEGRFLDISVGWPGSMAPAQILPRTKLYKARGVVLANGPSLALEGGPVPRYLVAGACCPLLPWLITPFRGGESGSNSSKGAAFNDAHARGLELAHRAFRRVRARWRLLDGRWKEECAEALPYVIVAGCLLHNYLIKCGEPAPDEVEVKAEEPGFPDFEGKAAEGGEMLTEVLASYITQVSATDAPLAAPQFCYAA